MGEQLRVQLLGRFLVTIGTTVVDGSGWRLRKAKSLVKLLALAPDHRLLREQILDQLWPELAPEAAENNLRLALHVARQKLGWHPRASYLLRHDDVVALGPADAVWTDIGAFGHAAEAARRSRDVDAYRAAVALYEGELLPEDRYESWAAAERERLRETYLGLLAELAQALERAGLQLEATETYRELLRSDAANEQAHAALMRLYALAGHRQQALRQYARLREALRAELDLEPSAAVRLLDEDIRAGRFPSPRTAPVEAERAARRHNLPSHITSFIGRERELRESRALLSEARLVSLVGAAGCGKTRLALEVATALAGDHADGVWLCELALLDDPDRVPEAVAAAAGVREESGRPLSATLIETLRPRRLLIVVDNCEHLVESCARLLGVLLREAPGLRVLATSRQPLGLTGEVVYRVGALPLPEGDSVSPATLVRSDAVRLFVERARSQRPEFALTARNAAAVARLCVRLGGMPLAIELAAARVSALSPEQIASRLDERFRLLVAASPTAPPRHRSLRAAIDWSFEHLGVGERELFGRLSVFSGGWTLEAAEAVCAGGSVAHDAVLDLLSHLVDKSLVSVGPARDGTVRYRFLETLHEYARGRLEGAERDAITRRHATYWAGSAEEAERHRVAPDQRIWQDRLDEDEENLRSAVRWCLETGDAVLALRLAGALAWYWRARSRFREGRLTLEAALALPSADGRLRAKVLVGAGASAAVLDDYSRARPLLDEAIGIYRNVGDQGGLAQALDWLSLLFEAQGDYAAAHASAEEALAIHRALGDRAEVARVLDRLSRIALDLGAYERGATLAQESLAIQRECGYELGAGVSLYLLGAIAFCRGEHPTARTLLEESLATFRKYDDAQRAAYALSWRGRVAAADGDHAGARVSQLEALAALHEQGDRSGVSVVIDALAELAAAEGHAARACLLAGAAAAVRRSIGAHLEPSRQADLDRVMAAARVALGPQRAVELWEEGKAMSLERALEEARGTGPLPSRRSATS